MAEKLSILPQNQAGFAPANEVILNQQESIYNNNWQVLPVQRKLTVGEVDDPLEDEADAMADTIMRMPEESFIQRKCAHCEEEEKLQRKPLASFIQRKESSAGAVASEAVTSKINSSKGNGSNMDRPTQSFMESRFGADFSNVRIHADNNSVQLSNKLNAQAFTVGNSIYFNEGQYNPNNDKGKHLLAHELTHTIQQGAAQKIQRYPWPYRLSMRREVDNVITETISGAPATQSQWNNTFNWHSRYRIELDAVAGEIRLIVRLHTTAPVAVRNAWERAIQRKWSNRMYLKITPPGMSAGPCKFPIMVDLRWTGDAARAHHTIIPQGAGGVAGGTVGLGGTSGMDRWGTGDTVDVTHEFGHMLGNIDEYFITNGTSYMTGGRTGIRDAGGGIMNNPAERIHRRHFNSLRRHVAIMLGLSQSAVRVIYNNDDIPVCQAEIGDFPQQTLPDGMRHA